MSEGKQISLGGRTFTLLPVPAIGLQVLGEKIAHLGSLSGEGIDALIDTVYYGVKRGAMADDTVTREFFAWNIDVTNASVLMEAVAAVNNLVMKETLSGEAQAGQ